MKTEIHHYWIMLAALLFGTWSMTVAAQGVIVQPSELTDVLSQINYDNINSLNRNANSQLNMTLKQVGDLRSVIGHQKDELDDLSPMLRGRVSGLQNFVRGSGFGSVQGYNSYGYLTYKYPIIHFNPRTVAKNKLTRIRLRMKLTKESNMIGEYLNPNLPIPEGQRILLVLMALDRAIKITLEDETF